MSYSKIVLFPLHSDVSLPLRIDTDDLVEFSFVILECPAFFFVLLNLVPLFLESPFC